MTFWTYMIQCGDRTFYVGHTNDLEKRWAEHQSGAYKGYTSTRQPLHLVWSEEFASREEARTAELKIKGWSRAEKLALIRGDWGLISALAKGRSEERASTSPAKPERRWSRSGLFLHPHSALLPSEPLSVDARASLTPAQLHLHVRITGDLSHLRIPPPATPAQRDGLWQHTCFEAFAELPSAYLEFNLSPSGDWAAYRFTGYREGMTNLDVPAPKAHTSLSDHVFDLTADLHLPPGTQPTRLGLSAVIEENTGHKSYWALRHPPGDRPDFHHPDCFALELSPASDA